MLHWSADLLCSNTHSLSCRPTSLESLLQLKKSYPDAKLVVGNTEVGIEMKFKNAMYPVLIGATHVPQLNKVHPLVDMDYSIVRWS